MSYVDELLAAYRRFVALPWQQNLAPPQRVWMAVYPPEYERRVRLHLPAFKAATNEHQHPWAIVDITTSFESWMAAHDYRDAYFEDPTCSKLPFPGSSAISSTASEFSSPSTQRPPALSPCSERERCSGWATG